MIRIAAVLALGGVAACAGGGEERTAARESRDSDGRSLGNRDCGRRGGDSARAVCTGLNEIERISGFPADLYAYQRRGDTICVETTPNMDEHATVDGGGVVEIVQGRLVTAFLVDSGGCRKF